MSYDKSRAWCFTLNNYTDLEYTAIQEIVCRYLLVGKEVGKCGTPHLQGYIYFDSRRSLGGMKKLIPRAHLEPAKGTPLQASLYCKKDGSFIEKGELPKQGARNDLEEIRDVIKKGGKMKDVVNIATSYQSVKMAEQILKYNEPSRTWKPLVKWFYGSTGTGKTRAAYEELGEDCYTCLPTGRWFDGYDAHENVLVDDMRRDFMKFHELLRFLDRYAFRVETKGGTRQLLAKKIIITSAFHPEQLFETREDLGQLIRRIDEIKKFGENNIFGDSIDTDDGLVEEDEETCEEGLCASL